MEIQTSFGGEHPHIHQHGVYYSMNHGCNKSGVNLPPCPSSVSLKMVDLSFAEYSKGNQKQSNHFRGPLFEKPKPTRVYLVFLVVYQGNPRIPILN